MNTRPPCGHELPRGEGRELPRVPEDAASIPYFGTHFWKSAQLVTQEACLWWLCSTAACAAEQSELGWGDSPGQAAGQ